MRFLAHTAPLAAVLAQDMLPMIAHGYVLASLLAARGNRSASGIAEIGQRLLRVQAV